MGTFTLGTATAIGAGSSPSTDAAAVFAKLLTTSGVKADCTGNGIGTDDTAALQAALTATGVTGKHVQIVFPPNLHCRLSGVLIIDVSLLNINFNGMLFDIDVTGGLQLTQTVSGNTPFENAAGGISNFIINGSNTL